MPLLDILKIPDPRLRHKCEPVQAVNDETRQLVDDMFETMYDAPGIGLAAAQINVQQRIFVMDISEDKSEPQAFINPVITHKEGKEVMQEGCLSIPDVYADVERAEKITVEALDKDGNAFKKDLDGLEAVCVQHEIDHLDGVLFIDYLSTLKRDRLMKKYEKQQKKAG